MARTANTRKNHYSPPMVPQYAARLRMEERYLARETELLLIEGAMRHEPSNDSRGSVIGRHGVNATTVSASARQRVRDSHDARPAKDRATARPYSARTLAQDIQYGRSPAKRCGDTETFTVPTWYVALLDGAALSAEARTAALSAFTRTPYSTPSDEREDRKARTDRKVSIADERAARQRAIAGTIRMGEQD